MNTYAEKLFQRYGFFRPFGKSGAACVKSVAPVKVFKVVNAINDLKDLKSMCFCRQKRSAAKHLKISRCICSKKYV